MKKKSATILTHASQLLTLRGKPGPRRGPQMADLAIIEDGAVLIENGKITAPVKGATLIGDGPTVLRRVTMVGNDLKLDHGVGICGKEGQNIPVSVGLPTIKIQEITVGGTEK